MGALTDTRKRYHHHHHHHRLPFSDSPLLFDLAAADISPPFKKPKLFSTLTTPPAAPAVADRTMQQKDKQPPVLRRYPPPAPLTRPVHGPQRIIKVFGLGSSNSRRFPPLDAEFGSFVSQHVKDKKASYSYSKEEASPRSGSHGSLGLEDYKRMVVDVQEAIPVPSSSAPAEASELPPVSELPLVIPEGEELSDLYVLDRKVADDGKVVVESTPVREERPWVRKIPLYKELYEASSRKRCPVLSELDFEVKFTEKKLSSFRLAREIVAKKSKEDLHGPFAPLTDEEEHVVDNSLQGSRRREVLVTHESSNIAITREILQCLSYGAWLNDEVINLYLELLKEREQREPKRFLKCHFFNSFFFKKLISGKCGYDFKAVRRWTSQRRLGYGLIECDKIFVPIHKEVHWCLAIINVKDKKFQYLDSLGGMGTTVLKTLARYFMDEVKDKNDKHIDTLAWKQETVGDLPLQENGWDCGMFMLKYTDFYSRNMGLDFGQEHMQYFRKRTIKEILRLRAE